MQTLHATSDDGTRLRLARWGDADRDVLLVHGLAEHVGRYEHVASAMVTAGWRVTAVELRGHGLSGGRRGHVKDWHRYVEDVQAAAAVVGRPFVLVAHSMGGLVSLATLAEPLTPKPKGVALSNPLLGVKVQPPAIKEKSAKLLSKLLPWLPLSNELDSSMISRDPDVVARYETDPLVFGTITPRWYTEMRRTLDQVHAAASKGSIPMRMMLSDADQICDAPSARKLAAAWGGDATIAEYPGLYHELFNEPEKDQVIRELIEWMETVWT